MSLNYDLSKIKNFTDVCYSTAAESDVAHGVVKGQRYMRSATQSIIFGTMAVGIGNLSAKNLPEFWARYDVWQRLHGFTGEDAITLEEVTAHVGLTTNVSMEPRAKWMKRIVTSIMDECASQVRIADGN
jgi:hypothetical protein